MPTPSDSRANAAAANGRRSVFGNFDAPSAPAESEAGADSTAPLGEAAVAPWNAPTLQEAIDTAVSRGFLHRFLAQAFDYPSRETWTWLCDPEVHATVRRAVRVLQAPEPERASEAALGALRPDAYDRFADEYVAAFGHGARGSCPINEIEYGDLRADPLFQPHRLADLGAFYRAFGLEFGEGGERADHLSAELEFMSVLALRRAQALEQQATGVELAINHEAETKFLREHLGRWTPAFARRVERALPDGPTAALATFLRAWVESDCARYGFRPGSEDLLLRPIDDGAETLCASCGLPELPPGAEPVPSQETTP